MSVPVMWIAVLFSVAIGVIFGLYPANKAAKKKTGGSTPVYGLTFSISSYKIVEHLLTLTSFYNKRKNDGKQTDKRKLRELHLFHI